MTTPLLIASDHAGYELKSAIQKLLANWKWQDLGPHNAGTSVDYPDFAFTLAEKISKNPATLGVLICGSGIGMSIAANKLPGVRAAVVENPVAARLAREHNHANILCLGARFVAPQYAVEILRAWLEATPSTEGRHSQRIKKIADFEK